LLNVRCFGLWRKAILQNPVASRSTAAFGPRGSREDTAHIDGCHPEKTHCPRHNHLATGELQSGQKRVDLEECCLPALLGHVQGEGHPPQYFSHLLWQVGQAGFPRHQVQQEGSTRRDETALHSSQENRSGEKERGAAAPADACRSTGAVQLLPCFQP